MVATGWFAHSSYIQKEIVRETLKAEARYESLRSRQTEERTNLEKQIASDRAKSQQVLGRLLKENSQLRAEADARVSIEFLIFSRLCESSDECALFYRRTEADGTTQALPPPTALDLYGVLRDVTDAIGQNNLKVDQINQQIRECKKGP